MKVGERNNLLLLLSCTLLFAGFEASALSYDYTASVECLANPHKPQYNGGIIINSEFNHGLKGWSKFGDAKIEHRESGGNKFIVAHSRNQPYDSVSQKLHLHKDKLYTFSAWIQVGQGNAPVTAVFKTTTGFKPAGAIVAESKCWSMLKGGLTVNASGPAELYFESKNTSVEIWVDSISLQPFTEEEWRSHQDQSTEKTRKRKVRIQAVDKQGNPVHNASISIEQKKLSFPFGCAINKNILGNAAYQNWFTSRFTFTTFEDEMKWYSTEPSRDREDYLVPDAMLQFAKQHNIAVRGHNILWNDPQYQTWWVKSLSPSDLSKAVEKRIYSIVSRYKGQLIGWDVINENLHFSFFESKLGQSASASFFDLAHQIDGSTTLFMNEYNTIEDSRDGAATPARYLQKLREIQSFPANRNAKMGIGLEGHFNTPNLPYMRASIDTLAATNLPVWLTEVDVQSSPNQAQYLEQILRETHSHPQVKGIEIWSAWKPNGCYRMCLTDNNFKNLATGNVVDKLLREWGGFTAVAGKTDANGFFESSLFHGDYDVKITHPATMNSSLAQSLKGLIQSRQYIMKVGERNNPLLLLVSCTLLFAGFEANAISYDYTASVECLANPHTPQYNGGIIINSEFNHGLKGWSKFGDAKIEHRESGGNKFIVAHSRNQPYDSVSQKLYLQKDKLYTFSAWIQVSKGNAPVTAVFKTTTGFEHAGAIVAESKCWSMLKGGLTVNASGPAELYFESKNISVEIRVDSISLQPFSEEEWRSHQDQSIEKTRKRKVRIQAVDKQGNPVHNASISIEQKKLSFPFGCAINKNILGNAAYQNWFTSRFTFTSFEDEMKWYSTENSQGHEDYSVPDSMLQFAKQHNIAVRGHNILWNDPNYQPWWVKSLSPSDLSKAVEKRINSIVSRYKGQLIAWDVINENLHFSFFESVLGQDTSARFFNKANLIDGSTTLFMNEYNTIEESGDGTSSPARYLEKLRAIQSFQGNRNIKMGIGLEGHFSKPNLPYMRASIDTLAATNLPVWLTEVDVQSSPNQAQYLEQILREAHSHPKVKGIEIWSAWNPSGCYRMCLTDNNFKNLATGNVVDKLLYEWGGFTALAGKTDANGFFEATLFHGDYDVKIIHPATMNSSFARSLKVGSTDESQQKILHLQVSA